MNKIFILFVFICVIKLAAINNQAIINMSSNVCKKINIISQHMKYMKPSYCNMQNKISCFYSCASNIFLSFDTNMHFRNKFFYSSLIQDKPYHKYISFKQKVDTPPPIFLFIS